MGKIFRKIKFDMSNKTIQSEIQNGFPNCVFTSKIYELGEGVGASPKLLMTQEEYNRVYYVFIVSYGCKVYGQRFSKVLKRLADKTFFFEKSLVQLGFCGENYVYIRRSEVEMEPNKAMKLVYDSYQRLVEVLEELEVENLNAMKAAKSNAQELPTPTKPQRSRVGTIHNHPILDVAMKRLYELEAELDAAQAAADEAEDTRTCSYEHEFRFIQARSALASATMRFDIAMAETDALIREVLKTHRL